MKNFFKVGVLALVLVLVTGCGGSKDKTLTCTKSEEQTGMKNEQTIKVSFDGDAASKLNMNMKMTIDEEYSSYIDTFKAMVDSGFESVKSKSGVSYDSKVNKNTISIDLELDVTKFTKDELGSLDLGASAGSYDDAKAAFEKQGYTCK